MRSHPPRTASTMLDAAFAALTAERLGLRRFRPQDLDTFVAYRSNPKIARNQNWEAPYRPSQARPFLRQLQAIHPDTPGQWFQFAVAWAEPIGSSATARPTSKPTIHARPRSAPPVPPSTRGTARPPRLLR